MRNLTLFAIICIVLGACTSKDSKPKQSAGAEQPEAKVNIKSKNLVVVKEFDHIISIGTIDIVFKHGDYSLEVEGDSVLLDMVKTDFDSNLLTVSLGTDGNPDFGVYHSTNSTKLYISAPSLKCVTVCNAGGFTCTDDWQEDEIQIGMLGNGNITLGNVECQSFLVESNGSGTMSIDHLKANAATLLSRSCGTFNIDCDVNDFSIVNSGKQSINLTGHIANKSFFNPKDTKLVDSTK